MSDNNNKELNTEVERCQKIARIFSEAKNVKDIIAMLTAAFVGATAVHHLSRLDQMEAKINIDLLDVVASGDTDNIIRNILGEHVLEAIQPEHFEFSHQIKVFQEFVNLASDESFQQESGVRDAMSSEAALMLSRVIREKVAEHLIDAIESGKLDSDRVSAFKLDRETGEFTQVKAKEEQAPHTGTYH
ncbi:hypothetical protein [Shewanella gaetbuli]|uniref:Uncharacterized protein n=1 Tax=Shewanella gaetbuli TaxID=220752 RepID=A0A9X1ZK29_9GAMM|nr:hypothetical protein [Shewanella gaetbuli]MCL1142961.1 hypothetical protein [Shewanella gaetbuli]